MSILDRILSKSDEAEIRKINTIVDKIDAQEERFKAMSDDELKNMTNIFKERLANGETLDDILVEAFAVAREASWRVLGMRQYRVQLIGGIVLHQGKIAEMKTGEGKTLVAVAPVYLNGLTGEGVHVVTVNDYLAQRDLEEMGQVYNFLGLTTGVIIADQTHEERKAQYEADIIYGTNNEFGFDYLRDNMAKSNEEKVQKKLKFAIVDEVDSILIDEARTPLIIAGQGAEGTEIYKVANAFLKTIKPEDYDKDKKENTIAFTESGIKKAEKFYGIENITHIENMEIFHAINQALRAHKMMDLDVEYVVRDGEILIVDEFTGRVMQGRRFTDGLHEAVEAKEGVEIKGESRTMATVTFQNFFRLYEKLSGMTGTAKTEEQEFESIYHMNVVQIPTNKPVLRADLHDRIFKTEKQKYAAVVEEIKEAHMTGQPILVGTVSVEKSEELSELLKKQGIQHKVLNAKQDKEEADIVSEAGKLGAITIATNMAGRGTDIKLGAGDKEEAKKVREAGGLYVIGTERHESRRIDNQLRGRSGRQGDPGKSRFFVSVEDEIIKLYGGKTIEKLSKKITPDEHGGMESKQLTKTVEKAQKTIEGKNFQTRKQVLEYDDVINEQRKVVYAERDKVLNNADISEEIQEMIKERIIYATETYLRGKDRDFVKYVAHLYNEFVPYNTLIIPGWSELSPEAIANQTYAIVENIYNLKKIMLGEDMVKAEERETLLTVVDSYWTYHIDLMDQMRQGIGLQASAQKDPVKEYTVEAGRMYDEMNMNIRKDTLKYLFGFAREALGQKEIDMDNIQTVSAEEYTQVVEPDEAQVEALAEYLNSLSDEEYAKVLEELGIDAEQDESGEWKIKE
ncbi:preprotein translocase subunit SecA [Peptacetobacter hiranonis]|uniref:preprotein translocase subunit SecA n=1 Tax=Peptacetobacter hiranonis TaxID=89152 RepID=UPI0022E2D811|nr:preprotein translocase subunit SecA [Peptacetobacter hiranonis]